MKNMIHARRRSTQQKALAIEKARAILQSIVDGSRDPYEGYREVYGIYLAISGMGVEELKPLFRLTGIDPDGCFQVDDEFRRLVVALAQKWLLENSK